MQSQVGNDRARRLGRPMASFSQRDLTLNEACPSVLGQHTAHQTIQPHKSVQGHASMRISAPRRVYSTFEDDTGTDMSSTSFATGSAVCAQNDPGEGSQRQGEDDSVADTVPFDDQFSTGRLRVQFDNSRNEVTEYSPSSQGSPGHPLAAAWFTVPSMSSDQGSELLEGPNPISGERPDLSPTPPSRCASNIDQRAGTFDELVPDPFQPKYAGTSQGTAQLQKLDSAVFLSIRTNSGVVADGDVQISRRASNMTDRAGTFSELVADAVPSVPAASAALNNSTQPLIDISDGLEMCPPTRKASESQQLSAGTSSGLPWQAPHGQPEGLDGSISRRYTNMCDAAGAFDDLVDEDGDVLSSSESESVEEEGSRAPTISFSGMLSGMPASTSPQECAPAPPRNGMRWQAMGPENPHSDLGMMPATVDAMGIAGVLPSDLCSEASDGGLQNPLTMDSNDKHDATNAYYLNASAAQLGMKDPAMFGNWFEDSLGGERSDRSLRLTEARTGSMNRSRGSSAAPPSSRRVGMYDCHSMPVTAETSTLSCTLSSAMSIRTPRTVIQKFTQDESEPLVSVLSTQEAFARVASMKEHGASHFHASDAENVPRVLPQQLQVVLPSEQDTSAMEHAVMTPQEWLNKVSNNVPSFPAAHMQLKGPAQGKAMVVSPVDDSRTMSSRLGAFRPEEESLL